MVASQIKRTWLDLAIATSRHGFPSPLSDEVSRLPVTSMLTCLPTVTVVFAPRQQKLRPGPDYPTRHDNTQGSDQNNQLHIAQPRPPTIQKPYHQYVTHSRKRSAFTRRSAYVHLLRAAARASTECGRICMYMTCCNHGTFSLTCADHSAFRLEERLLSVKGAPGSCTAAPLPRCPIDDQPVDDGALDSVYYLSSRPVLHPDSSNRGLVFIGFRQREASANRLPAA